VSAILGFEFYQGPEVAAPEPVDYTQSLSAINRARDAWVYKLVAAIDEHNAWGLLGVKPNADVFLYDIWSTREATANAVTVHLLLAREAKP
jgi:hypothetical protein